MVHKDIIDKIINDYYEGKIPVERLPRGCGRAVLTYENYAIKFPHFVDNSSCGVKQNSYEEYVTNTLKEDTDLKWYKEIFNPVIYTYRGVNVYNKLLTDTNEICSILGLDNIFELEGFIKSKYKNKLTDIVPYLNLQLDDCLHADNWGYDLYSRSLKCLDYGVYEDYYEDENEVACEVCPRRENCGYIESTTKTVKLKFI
ncbi:hypothetical protein [Paraclostridium bifermentans]|uniref:hypothetical protein n=1 Tax=Paraclostridium bifermentans TaxID=1490 RepID=UPI00374FCABC